MWAFFYDCEYSMKFKITTLVDITNTNARKGDDALAYKQQANYMTVFQTIGLRVNAYPLNVESHVDEISKLGFGKDFEGKNRYWTFTFTHEVLEGLTTDLLIQDFDLVPFIDGLNETVTIKNAVFRTSDPRQTNIIFEELDDK